MIGWAVMMNISDNPWEHMVKGKRNTSRPLSQYMKTTTGHLTNMHNYFSIIGREWHGFVRTMKESIYIRVNDPTLDRNIGKYNLPHIWDGVLANNSELQIKHQWELPQHQQAHRTLLVSPRTPYMSAESNNFPGTWRSQSMYLVKSCLDEVRNILFN